MGFLEDFDRRRDRAARQDSEDRKRGDPPPEGEAPEHRELLDFADLVREKCGDVPPGEIDEERVRLLERVRAAERSRKRRSRLLWISSAGAAAAAVLVAAVLVGLRRGPAAPEREEGAPVAEKDLQQVEPLPPRRLVREAVAEGAADEFAGLAFPEVRAREARGTREAELPFEKDRARLVRSRGLVLARRKGASGWRLFRRGQVLAPGESVRTSRRLESGAIIKGPDGSRVALRAGATVVFEGPRSWRITEGEAHFRVASGEGLGEFVVENPGGKAVAKGTEFTVRVEPDATTCRVASGTVELAPPRGAAILLREGESGALRAGGAVRLALESAAGWLKTLESDPADDHGVGELLARAEGDKDAEMMPLEIKSHKVTVTVVHPVARTFIDEIFVNNTDRRMEGVFYYTLPPDAAVSEFAMYVGDKRILGEVLEQHRARQVFEYIRRERRDPALLEWVGGNLFKMRVFPIEPRSEKRIQLGYTQVLKRDRGVVAYSYPLVSEKLKKNPLRYLEIAFRVASSQGLEDLACTSHRAEPVMTDDGRGALSFSARDYTPERDFTVAYRVDDSIECLAFANARPDEEEGYFLLELAPKLDLPERVPAERMLVVVDGSASAGPQGYALASEFASAAADFTLGWEMGVMVAGAETRRWREGFVEAGSETSEEVREFLSEHLLLGGTDLYRTFRAAAEAIPPGEEVELVYVGDGIDTLGELEGPALVREIASLFREKKIRGSCVAVGSAYDEPFLRSLAAALGGSYVRVDAAQDVLFAADDILESVSRPVLSDIEVTLEGIRATGAMPERLAALPAGSSAVVVGRLAKGGAGEVVLRGQAEGEAFERAYPVVLEPDTERNRFVPRLWARARIEDLMSGLGLMTAEDDARIRQEVIDTSVKYQIMSPFTAFLVLESEQDYKRFGIRRRLKMWDWKGDEAGLEFGAAEGLPFEGRAREDARESAPRGGFDSVSVNYSLQGAAAASGPVDAVVQARFIDVDERFLEDTGLIFNGILPAFENKRLETGRLEAGRPDGRWWRDKSAISDIRLRGTGILGMIGAGRRRSRRGSGGPISLNGPAYYAPQHPLVLHSGEVAGLKVDSPRKASWEYRRLIAAGKGSPETQLNLALALEAEGRFGKALSALGPVIEKHPEVSDLRLEQGVLAARAGDDEGMKRAFARAVEVAEDDKRAQIEERVPQLLTNLQRQAEAAEFYEKLARESEDVAWAAGRYYNAANNYVKARKNDRGRKLWDEAMERFPEESMIFVPAAQWHLSYGKDPSRAIELFRKAEKLGAKVGPQLIGALVSAGERDEAAKLARQLLAKLGAELDAEPEDEPEEKRKQRRSAKWNEGQQLLQQLVNVRLLDEAFSLARKHFKVAEQQYQIYALLSTLTNRDRERTVSEALRLLEGRDPHALAGAVQYFQNYARNDQKAVEAVLKAAARPDFPAQALQQAFYLLWNSGRRGKEVLGILEPLFEDTSTPEAVQRAVNALSSFVHNTPEEALRYTERLMGLDGAEKHRTTLRQYRWQALQHLGRKDEAERAMESAFKKAKDEGQAYQAANQLFRARLGRGDAKGAADIVLDFGKRFPDSQYMSQMYQQLFQNLKQRGKKDEIAELIERLAEGRPENASFALARAKGLARDSKFRDAAKLLRETLAKAEERRAEIEKERPEDPAPAPKVEDFADRNDFNKVHAEWWKKQQAAARWRAKLDLARRAPGVLIFWLGRASSQDEELKARFMKEAAERRESEDPVAREWTEGALACLEASGDEAAWLARLERLVSNESRDPLWPYRLGYAYLRAENLKKAYAILSKLSDEDPEDAGLAMTLHAVSLRLRDADAAERYRLRAFEALKRNPQTLQQLANQWQQSRPEWAFEAWRHLAELGQWRRNGYAAYQAAQLAQKLGRIDEAAGLYFQSMAAPQGSYGHNAVQQIAAMCKEEEVLRRIDPVLREALARKTTGAQAVYLRILAYRLAKIRGRDEEAGRQLTAATKLDLPPNGYNAGNAVVNALVEEKRFDDAERYAFWGGGKLTRDGRRQLIRNAASQFRNKNAWRRSVRLHRKLLEESDQNRENDHRNLVEALVRGGRLTDAEAELRRMEVGQNPWGIQNAYQTVSRAYDGKGEYDKAAKLALEGWRKLRGGRSGYGNRMLSHLVNSRGLRKLRYGGLSAEVRRELKKALIEAARESLAGETTSSVHWLGRDVLKKLGVAEEIEKLAREAARSDDGRRVMRAAEYSRNVNRHVEAKKRYEKALELGGDRRQVLQSLYGLAVDRRVEDWGSALDYLEELKKLGAHDEFHYLQERGRCLYGLGRRDEAREECRKAVRLPQYARQGWRASEFASYADQAKDYEFAAELWEITIRATRAYGGRHRGHFYSYYGALAGAYEKAGLREKAVDAYLRGLSVLSRTDPQAGYDHLLKQMSRFMLKNGGVDAALRRYEEEIEKEGGAEKPHLRIAFGEAYKKARKTREALGQFKIASDLIPKDIDLRREVIEGYRKLGAHEAAIDAYLSWARLDPQNIEIYKGLGDLYDSLGRRDEALAAWQTMAEVRPREAAGHRAYGKTLVKLGELERAALALRKAVRFRPTEFDVARELGEVYTNLDRNELLPDLWRAGEAACRRSVEDLPDDPQPWLNLGRFLAEQGRLNDERELYDEIIRRPWPRFRWETVREARGRLQSMTKDSNHR